MRLAFVLLAALAACAPVDPGLRLQHARPAALPGDVDWAEQSFAARDGLALYAQRWRPAAGDVKAVVVIHHGLADHSDRYAAFATELVHHGYAVWALDMRGHGRSAGARVVADDIDDYVDDLDRFVHLVGAAEPGKPIFLYGHSLGGLITATYAIERQPAVAGVVLAAPGLAFDAPPIQVGAVRVLAVVNPNAPALDTPHRGFSRRDDVVAEMDHDPLIYQPKGPVRTARAALDGVARVWAAPERMRAPLLVVHGTADTICAPSGSRAFVARAGSADKTLRLYDGLVHDLLREPDGGGARVEADVIAWLDAHTGGPAIAAPPALPDGPLRGDHHGRAMSVEVDARGERGGGSTGVTGGTRVRFGFGRPLGWWGGLDLRGGTEGGAAHFDGDAYPLGVVLRAQGGALIAITAGVGLGGVRGIGATRAPIELDLELPAGPLRLLARAGLAWRLGGASYAGDAHGIADEASALLGVRLGRDRAYWPELAGGGGPYVAVTYRDLGGVESVGVALGVDLFGGD